jgi:steroid 5-alpha reductase family enzyme
MNLLHPWLFGAAAVGGAAVLLWLLSIPLRNVAIVDVFWGPAFLLASVVYRLQGPAAEPRQLLLLALVGIWSLRLGGYILLRARGKAEDYRYAAMRAGHGPRFWWVSLFTVFLLQATLVTLIALPLLVVQAQATAAGWRLTDLLGVGLWAVGFAFEAGGDWQMARFKASSANRGKVMDRGFWRYSRHPNYFGDAAQWWGFWLISLAAPGGWWTVLGPVVMTFFLVRVSGVALLEKTIVDRRPEYRAYIEATPAFLPWFPKAKP